MKQLAGVLEGDDAVAEQAPALLRTRRDDAGRIAVHGVGARAGRLVLAHEMFSPLCGLEGGGVPPRWWRSSHRCGVGHMNNHARYPFERCVFEQVTALTA